jgi:hypothetical protein
MFFDSRWEDRKFWTEWYQALPEFNLLLISCWIKFWFLTVIPIYLNSDTFSNDSFVYKYEYNYKWDCSDEIVQFSQFWDFIF